MIATPGANNDMNGATLLNQATTSLLSVAPTLTAEEMQPGVVSSEVDEPLPAAMTVAMPIERRLSMAGL